MFFSCITLHASSQSSLLQRHAKGGVITLTTTNIDSILHEEWPLGGFSGPGLNGLWTGGEIEPAWENCYESQEYKLTATCMECRFKELCVMMLFTPPEIPPSPPPPPSPWRYCLTAIEDRDGCLSLR